MAYANAWNELYPPNSLAANQIHLAIQYWAVAVRERLNDVFGTTDWATAVQPFQPVQINFRGATPAIRGGSASLRFRNNADTLDNITMADAGDLTARRNLISTNNLVSNNDLVFNAANARILPGTTSIRFRTFFDSADNLVILDSGDTSIRGNLTVPNIIMGTATARIISGAISLALRNNANTLDNLLITDAGDVTVRASLDFNVINNNKPVTLAGLTTLKKLATVFFDNGNSGAAANIDFNTGNYQYLTLTGNAVLTFLNPVINVLYWVRLKQDVPGSRGAVFPANVIPTPVPSSIVSGHSQLVALLYDGTDYLLMSNTDHIR